jgi:phosphatidylinositol alpha-1,6-mannosyltransferase
MAQLSPGVDVDLFTPSADGAAVRRRHGLGKAPVVVCVSRLVPRKGQDVLVAAWPRVLARHPDARLLLVGGGPAERSLRRAVAARGLEHSVVLAGPVAVGELPGHYAAGDVFAMPCRTRRGGLDVEGLGMVFLEAAACGRPVVAGTSGGAPETVQEGVTGHVVEPRSPEAVATTIADLLAEPGRARAMGTAGRAWVEQRWSWTTIAATFAELLEP